MKCFFCDKHLDLAKDEYARSVTHNVYFHPACWNEHELLLKQGKIKNLYDKDELRSLSADRS